MDNRSDNRTSWRDGSRGQPRVQSNRRSVRNNTRNVYNSSGGSGSGRYVSPGSRPNNSGKYVPPGSMTRNIDQDGFKNLSELMMSMKNQEDQKNSTFTANVDSITDFPSLNPQSKSTQPLAWSSGSILTKITEHDEVADNAKDDTQDDNVSDSSSDQGLQMCDSDSDEHDEVKDLDDNMTGSTWNDTESDTTQLFEMIQKKPKVKITFEKSSDIILVDDLEKYYNENPSERPHFDRTQERTFQSNNYCEQSDDDSYGYVDSDGYDSDATFSSHIRDDAYSTNYSTKNEKIVMENLWIGKYPQRYEQYVDENGWIDYRPISKKQSVDDNDDSSDDSGD